MNMTQMMTLLDRFQAVYGRHYRHAGRTWWRWDPDQRCWDSVWAQEKMARALHALALDAFPEDRKFTQQVTRGYIQAQLLKALAPVLSSDTLPADPMSE